MLSFDVFIFISGAAIGSFLNVCIARLPGQVSLVSPSSSCPQCRRPIRFYDNIPLVSFFVLRGRCRDCGGRISRRYPLVEFLTGGLAVLLWRHFGPGAPFIFHFIFVSALLLTTFIDYDHQIIPDLVTLPGIPFFSLAAVLFLDLTFWDSFFGLVAGGGSLYLLGLFHGLITGREGMGGGDIKLLAMIGAFLGWQSLLFVVLVSSFLGAAVGVALILSRGKDLRYAVPFGPFLAVGAVGYIFLGDHLLAALLLLHRSF